MMRLIRATVRLLGALGWLVRSVVGRALDVLAPARCAACDAILRAPAVFCPSCAHSVDVLSVDSSLGSVQGEHGGPPVPVVAFAAYGGALAEALHRFKYRDRPDLARPLGELARRAVAMLAEPIDVVVPVPLHYGRLAQRGYNQSAIIGRAVARQIGVPLRARALRRARPTRPQVALRGAERRKNVEGAFQARSTRAISGRSVLLVDDVSTTGATIAECARALRAAGARSVRALVIARATDRGLS